MTFHTRHQFEKKLPAFKEWLTARGAEVLTPTNQYEVVRFRANGSTLVVYAKGTGQLNYDGETGKALNAFTSPSSKWSAGVSTKRVQRPTPVIRRLLDRDGTGCFLCRQHLGDDITVEHLVPVVHGGPDHIANKALAHSSCNARMGHRSLMEKIQMREAFEAPAPVVLNPAALAEAQKFGQGLSEESLEQPSEVL